MGSSLRLSDDEQKTSWCEKYEYTPRKVGDKIFNNGEIKLELIEIHRIGQVL